MLRKLFRKKRKVIFFDLTPDQDEYLADAIQIYNRSQKEGEEKYGFTTHEVWGVNQENRKFLLKNDDKVAVSADGQLIGSFSSYKFTWEWAWNNPSVDPNMKKSSLLVKEYGEKEGLEYFCEGILKIPDETYAPYLAAVGQKASGSESVYRGVMGDLSIFILLNNFEVHTS